MSLSAMYRQMRKRKDVSLIGDTVLIFYIFIFFVEKLDRRFNRSQMQHLFQQSNEYQKMEISEKSSLINCLEGFQKDANDVSKDT